MVSVRDMQYIFVNRRPIDSKTVQQAIYKAYQNVRPKDRHPAFLVYMTLNPADFDVNIHPQKRDIRFVNESKVFGFVMNAAGETIFKNARPVQVTLPSKIDLPAPAQPAAEKLFTPSPMETFAQTVAEPLKLGDFKPKNNFTLRETEEPAEYVARPEEPSKMPSVPAKSVASPAAPADLVSADAPEWYRGPYHYLGQLQRSYLLFENPEGLVLIDQHAAQERVLFEKYMDAFEKRDIKVQELMFPIQVDLTPSNAESLMSWAPWLKTAGFELTRFSPRTVQVKTMPYVVRFKEDDMKRFVESLAAVVGDPAKSTETLKRKMVAMLACKKAVKAHDSMTAAEAEALLENMKKCKDGMHCPHGRACVAQLHIREIGKLFGR